MPEQNKNNDDEILYDKPHAKDNNNAYQP